MYSIEKIDGKEYNTAKGVSISSNFDKFKDSIFLNKNLVFIDSMQFMNSSLYTLVKNLSDKDFK